MLKKTRVEELNNSQVSDLSYNTETSAAVNELTRLLASVESDSKQAKLNETSISDNNGGRILL